MEELSRRQLFGRVGDLLKPTATLISDTVSILSSPAPDIEGPMINRREFIQTSAAGVSTLYLFGHEIPFTALSQEEIDLMDMNTILLGIGENYAKDRSYTFQGKINGIEADIISQIVQNFKLENSQLFMDQDITININGSDIKLTNENISKILIGFSMELWGLTDEEKAEFALQRVYFRDNGDSLKAACQSDTASACHTTEGSMLNEQQWIGTYFHEVVGHGIFDEAEKKWFANNTNKAEVLPNSKLQYLYRQEAFVYEFIDNNNELVDGGIDLTYYHEFRAELIDQITYQSFINETDRSTEMAISYRFNGLDNNYYRKIVDILSSDTDYSEEQRKSLFNSTRSADILGFAKIIGNALNNDQIDPIDYVSGLDRSQWEIALASDIPLPWDMESDTQVGLRYISNGSVQAKLSRFALKYGNTGDIIPSIDNDIYNYPVIRYGSYSRDVRKNAILSGDPSVINNAVIDSIKYWELRADHSVFFEFIQADVNRRADLLKPIIEGLVDYTSPTYAADQQRNKQILIAFLYENIFSEYGKQIETNHQLRSRVRQKLSTNEDINFANILIREADSEIDNKSGVFEAAKRIIFESINDIPNMSGSMASYTHSQPEAFTVLGLNNINSNNEREEFIAGITFGENNEIFYDLFQANDLKDILVDFMTRLILSNLEGVDFDTMKDKLQPLGINSNQVNWSNVSEVINSNGLRDDLFSFILLGQYSGFIVNLGDIFREIINQNQSYIKIDPTDPKYNSKILYDSETMPTSFLAAMAIIQEFANQSSIYFDFTKRKLSMQVDIDNNFKYEYVELDEYNDNPQGYTLDYDFLKYFLTVEGTRVVDIDFVRLVSRYFQVVP